MYPVRTWRHNVIHWVAKTLGLLVHIEGLPYGSIRNIDFKNVDSGDTQSEWAGCDGARGQS